LTQLTNLMRCDSFITGGIDGFIGYGVVSRRR
jgi:hypothetical protein